jgi:hypothetical protein
MGAEGGKDMDRERRDQGRPGGAVADIIIHHQEVSSGISVLPKTRRSSNFVCSRRTCGLSLIRNRPSCCIYDARPVAGGRRRQLPCPPFVAINYLTCDLLPKV